MWVFIFILPVSCGGEEVLYLLYNQVQYISSPNYPDRYPYDLDCTWYFTTNLTGAFVVRLHDLYTPSRDVLSMGNGLNSSIEQQVLLSRKYFPNSVTFEGSDMWIRFKSDGRSSYRGFFLTIEREENPGKN